MFDIHAVGAVGGKRPVLDRIQFRQVCDQHHGRIADGQEYPLFFGVDHAPARSAGKVHGPCPITFQSEHLELGAVGVVSDAGNDRNLQGRNDRGGRLVAAR